MFASDVTFAGLALRGFMGLLIPVILSGAAYFGINFVARQLGRRTWTIYACRLGIMIGFTAVWWFCYGYFFLRAHAGNALSADNWYRVAFREGVGLGMHSLWAWFIVALIDRPTIKAAKA